MKKDTIKLLFFVLILILIIYYSFKKRNFKIENFTQDDDMKYIKLVKIFPVILNYHKDIIDETNKDKLIQDFMKQFQEDYNNYKKQNKTVVENFLDIFDIDKKKLQEIAKNQVNWDIPNETNDYEFIGCFKEKTNDRAIPNLLISDVRKVETKEHNFLKRCVEECKAQKYIICSLNKYSCYGCNDCSFDKHGYHSDMESSDKPNKACKTEKDDRNLIYIPTKLEDFGKINETEEMKEADKKLLKTQEDLEKIKKEYNDEITKAMEIEEEKLEKQKEKALDIINKADIKRKEELNKVNKEVEKNINNAKKEASKLINDINLLLEQTKESNKKSIDNALDEKQKIINEMNNELNKAVEDKNKTIELIDKEMKELKNTLSEFMTLHEEAIKEKELILTKAQEEHDSLLEEFSEEIKELRKQADENTRKVINDSKLKESDKNKKIKNINDDLQKDIGLLLTLNSEYDVNDELQNQYDEAINDIMKLKEQIDIEYTQAFEKINEKELNTIEKTNKIAKDVEKELSKIRDETNEYIESVNASIPKETTFTLPDKGFLNNYLMKVLKKCHLGLYMSEEHFNKVCDNAINILDYGSLTYIEAEFFNFFNREFLGMK